MLKALARPILRFGRKAVDVTARPFLRIGSAAWLASQERKYGGITNAKINRVSPCDRRTELEKRRMVGGDRMSNRHHGYAKHYARHLKHFIGKPVTLVEVGILRGTGLAIWSDLFPSGQIIGLDIDLSNFHRYEPTLRHLGAFVSNNVSVSEFDQFTCTSNTFSKLLDKKKIDIFIDDGLHSDETILRTLRAAKKFLADPFLYIVEDNDSWPSWSEMPQATVERHGLLTILS